MDKQTLKAGTVAGHAGALHSHRTRRNSADARMNDAAIKEDLS
jgi:hypothetical protein